MPSSTCRKSMPANLNWKTAPSMDSLLASAAAMVQDKATARQVALIVHQPAQALTLRGDRTRLQQAVLNYLSNAVKFTDAGQIEVGCQVLERTASDVLLRIAVKDTGIGIAPDVLPACSPPSSRPTTRPPANMAAPASGLAITRKIAELMQANAGPRAYSARAAPSGSPPA